MRARLELVQLIPGVARLLKHFAGNIAVDFGAGQLFQQFGALVGAGVQERCKTALRQQHRLGKAREIQAGDGRNEFELFAAFFAQDGAVAGGQLNFRCLQRATDFVAGAPLAPKGAIDDALDLEFHLGQTVGGMARHEVVDGRGDVFEARRLVVQRQANRVEQG